MKAKINQKTLVMHDFRVFKWPYTFDPELVFDAIYENDCWHCSADGYGYGIPGQPRGEYGNGCFLVFDKNGITMV